MNTLFDETSHAEVANFYKTITVDEYIRRFQVTMHDAY